MELRLLINETTPAIINMIPARYNVISAKNPNKAGLNIKPILIIRSMTPKARSVMEP